jgi:ubiquinone/menaquinone biosynthesis C-methylase UbiE
MDEYGKEFYERAIEQEGVDYNFYGDWQRDYAKMVIDITGILEAASNDREALIIDVGCACGVQLRGFKETKVFGNHIGIDISEYLLELGKKTHGFTDDEMVQVDIINENLPLEDESVTFLHCVHTLEHIPEEALEHIFSEFNRVLKPEVGYGLIIVPAIKPGIKKEGIEREKSHVTVKTMQWWRKEIAKVFDINNDVRKAFKESKFSPIGDPEKNFHHFYNIGWTIFGFTKK